MSSKLIRNPGLKLLSLIIAIGLFEFVSSQSNTSVFSFIAPVELRNIPANKILVWPLKLQTQVTVRGPSFMLTQLTSATPVIRVELPADVENRYTFNIRPSELDLPPKFDVVNIDPAEIEFTFDEILEKQVPVLVPRIGSVDKAFNLLPLKISPEKVTVRGPYSEVKGIRSVQSYPIDLREVTATTELELPVRVPGKLTKVSHENVVVTVPLEIVEQEKDFKNVAVEIRAEPGLEVVADPPQVAVTLTGPARVMSKVDSSQLRPYVNVRQGQSQGEVMMVAPAETKIVNIKPSAVNVSIVGIKKGR